MTFDPTEYWNTHQPPVYPAHREQEAAIQRVLDDLPYESALEVGCGNGRITNILRQPVTVMDISERVYATAERTGATPIHSSLQDFTTDERWDLVIAVEVLMHIPPSDIEAACDKLRSMAKRWVVTCDWTQPLGKPTGEHNWLHDYRALLRPTREVPVGRQTIFITETA